MLIEKQYDFKKKYEVLFEEPNKKVFGKVAFKAQKTDWVETPDPVVVLVSIYSAFHLEVKGDLQMDALMKGVRENVKGKVTVLFTDQAHINVEKLKDGEKAFGRCLDRAHELKRRYDLYVDGCNVVYWNDYINHDPQFFVFMEQLKELYKTNSSFREQVCKDAEATYTDERKKEFPNESVFIENAKKDLLEQCAGILVLEKKGYRFYFYPGEELRTIKFLCSSLKGVSVYLKVKQQTCLEIQEGDSAFLEASSRRVR